MYLILLLLVLLPLQLVAVDPSQPMPTPLMRVVDPGTAKIGDVVTVTGDNLNKELVAEVYLTAGESSYKVELISQSAKEIKFRVPADVKAGPYRISVLLTSVEPTMIEEPVRIVIEE